MLLRPLLPCLLGLCLIGAACGSSGGSGRPVVVVVIDTLRADALGCYGAQGDPTPRIDAVAAEGTRFEQALSTSGWTLPSMASLLTGTWPSVHKAMGKKTRLTPISADVPTAGEVLQEHGFATGAVANAAFLSHLLDLDRGFDLFDHEHAFNREIRPADASVAAALDFVEEQRGEDFFLLLHVFDPHLDYDPRPEDRERFMGAAPEPAPPFSAQNVAKMIETGGGAPSETETAMIRAAYQAEVAFVDRAIGLLVDALRDLDLWEQATFILTADHGEEFWEHGGFEHGHSLYDELVRVPLIVKAPASVPVGAPTIDAQVRVLDVMPTVFDLLEIQPPPSFIGASLLPYVRGETRESRPTFLEGTLYGLDREGYRDDRYKYLVNKNESQVVREELYSWRTDPGEERDLAQQRPGVLAEMRAAYDRMRAEIDSAAAATRPGEVQNIRPDTLFQQSIDSLGYSGGKDEEQEPTGPRDSNTEGQ